MEIYVKFEGKGVKFFKVVLFIINDFYERMREFIGEVEKDFYKFLKEMWDVCG